MEGNGKDEQQDLVGCAFVVVAFGLEAAEFMQVGRDIVQQADVGHTCRHAEDRLPYLGEGHHVHRRKDEAHQRRSQHHARAAAKEDVVPFVWNTLDEARPMPDPRSDARPSPAAETKTFEIINR